MKFESKVEEELSKKILEEQQNVLTLGLVLGYLKIFKFPLISPLASNVRSCDLAAVVICVLCDPRGQIPC